MEKKKKTGGGDGMGVVFVICMYRIWWDTSKEKTGFCNPSFFFFLLFSLVSSSMEKKKEKKKI